MLLFLCMDPGLVGLFFGCFLSATIIPFFSESIVFTSLLSGYDPLSVLVFSSAGNWAGGLTNYMLGILGNEYIFRKWMRTDPVHFRKYGEKINRYGHWLSLLVWVPVIGDPLTVALGIFRVSFWKFAILSLLSRTIRYFLLIYILNFWI